MAKEATLALSLLQILRSANLVSPFLTINTRMKKMKNAPHRSGMAGLQKPKMSIIPSSNISSSSVLSHSDGGEEVLSDFVSAYAAATVVCGHKEVIRILGRLCQCELVRGLLQILTDYGTIRTYRDEIELGEILCGLYRKEMVSELRVLIVVLLDLH